MIKMCFGCIRIDGITLVLKTNQMFESALYAIYKAAREIQDSKKTIKRSSDDDGRVSYYKSVKRAYDQSWELRDYLGRDIKKQDINKSLKELWEITYWIFNEEQKLRVISKDPNNLLVSWF